METKPIPPDLLSTLQCMYNSSIWYCGISDFSEALEHAVIYVIISILFLKYLSNSLRSHISKGNVPLFESHIHRAPTHGVEKTVHF